MEALTKDNFLPLLAGAIYTPENIQRAAQYLASRGIDANKMYAPCARTPRGSGPYEFLKDLFNPFIFEDSIFMPVEHLETSIKDTPELAAFDVRYLGELESRTRYQKFKANQDVFLVYGLRDIMAHPEYPLIVTEGILDSESVRQLGLPLNTISNLTAAHNEKWVSFLLSLSSNIWFAYDNDDAGRKATKNILESVKDDPESQCCFNILAYPEKDLNKALCTIGHAALKELIQTQMGL